MTGRELITALINDKDINLDTEIVIATKDGAFSNGYVDENGDAFAKFHIKEIYVPDEPFAISPMLMFEDIRHKNDSSKDGKSADTEKLEYCIKRCAELRNFYYAQVMRLTQENASPKIINYFEGKAHAMSDIHLLLHGFDLGFDKR